MTQLSPYDQVISRKRKWTPLAVQKGEVVEGSEDALKRALGLRHLELPVREFLQQGLDRELPNTPGLREALLSNQKDEENHDLALNYVIKAHGAEEKYEDEAKHILRDANTMYDKGLLAEILEPIMGKGLIPADPETWSVRRRQIVPAFHKGEFKI